MRALILLVMAGSVAEAETFEARWLSAENIHMAEGRGAISRRDQITISLELGGGGKARVDEEGYTRDHHLHEDNGTTEHKVVWTNAWVGTWKRTGDKLAVALTLDSHACKATVTFNRGQIEPETCRTTSKQLKLACTSQSLGIAEKGRVGTAKVWNCQAEAAELGHTPSVWVFGKERCIEAGRGRGAQYRPCPTP